MMAIHSIQYEAPHWENLECIVDSHLYSLFLAFGLKNHVQTGHKYLFSDFSADWPEAYAECELYGGWLVNIDNIGEHNCLLRHASAQNYASWYWTGGKNLIDS